MILLHAAELDKMLGVRSSNSNKKRDDNYSQCVQIESFTVG